MRDQRQEVDDTGSGDGLLGPVLLEEPEQREQHDDGTNRPCLQILAQGQREQRRADEDEHHHRRHLIPDDLERVGRSVVGQFIRTDADQALLGLVRRETIGRGMTCGQSLIDTHAVPRNFAG